ncbi:sigma-54 dependent transcriptional regulator [soil metagenome]
MPIPHPDSPLIVVIDDELNMGKALAKLLGSEGLRVKAFDRPGQAIEFIRANPTRVVLSDLRMPDMTGEAVLERVKTISPTCEVILMTAYGTVESAMRCVRLGAYDYVTKPFDAKGLIATVRRALARSKDVSTRISYDSEADAQEELIGDSPEISAARELIRKVAPADSAVLISGESGTGKELAARAIHRLSRRTGKPFVAINCASIPENLIESELFGHERGAFTGANEARAGLIESAQGGTLFLDEIGELPINLQAKLLRVLQEREITRVGSVTNIPVDIRVVAATNRRLENAVQSAEFRQDLFYRLNVLAVRMPALRHRPVDIPILATHFLREFAAAAGKPDVRWEESAIEALKKMQWPGNVRELRNFVERLVVLTDCAAIGIKEIRESVSTESAIIRAAVAAPTPSPVKPPPATIPDFREARDRFESDYLRAVLKASDGNVSEAAKRAGMSRRNFYEKIEKLKIDLDQFKTGGSE